MLSTLRKYLLIPKLVRLSSGAPRDPLVAWDRYWGKVQATGAKGEVLWDSGSDNEMNAYMPELTRHLDPDRPVVDVGCGNGSFTRLLAPHFPHALGVDVSVNAIGRAGEESRGIPNISFLAADMTAPDGVQVVHAALAEAGVPGESNIFIRGVLHVLERSEQAALARNLHSLVGVTGRVFLTETDFPGSALDYVTHLGATLESIPAPLEGAIRGLPMPGRFGPAQREKAFPASQWELLADGASTIETRPLKSDTGTEHIPGYFAVLRAI